MSISSNSIAYNRTPLDNRLASIEHFGHHLTELTDCNVVNLEDEQQVKFFLKFLEMFKVDQSQITIYGYQCVELDVEHDYPFAGYTYTVKDTSEGYLIVLGDMSEEKVLTISGVSNADDYTLELETETFITVGGV
jgi:hypothetical protein